MNDNYLNSVWPEWKIIRKIGSGGFGSVYEAVRLDYQVESRAAIKVISIPKNESEIDSLCSEGMTVSDTKEYLRNIVNEFIGEIRLMESLKGMQNIVSVEDYQVVEREYKIGWDIYIRMELLTPFNTYIGKKSLNEEEVIRLGCDICTALELCAKRNIIHRDIKPENIFVNDFGDFKLGDFGIARKLENITEGLSKKGTYNYMAPEVFLGRKYDATVDVYSLGLVMYRLLNKNRLPFWDMEKQVIYSNERVEAFKLRISGAAFPAPCQASEAMTKIIFRACDPDPKKRFQSASEMKRALLDVKKEVEHRHDVEKKNEQSVQHSKTVDKKKNKGKMAFALMIILVLEIAVVFKAVQLIRENMEKREAAKSEETSAVIETPKKTKTPKATQTPEGTPTSEATETAEVTQIPKATQIPQPTQIVQSVPAQPIPTPVQYGAAIQSDSHTPFYGIWCDASKDEAAAYNYAAVLARQGLSTQVFLTSDWSNLNSERYYAVTAGVYASEAEANAALQGVQVVYPDAYVKYTGSWRGDTFYTQPEVSQSRAVQSQYAPFYGIWCDASKNREEAYNYAAALAQQGLSTQVFLTSDWSNLNSEDYYAVTAGVYASEAEANAALPGVQAVYPDAYVKYTGSLR